MSYIGVKSVQLNDLRTIRSSAIAYRKNWHWTPGWVEWYKRTRLDAALDDLYLHDQEEIDQMRADLDQVIAILDKYKRQ